MIEVFHRMFRLMHELDCTTVAIVNGRCLGGGVAYELLRHRDCIGEGKDRSTRDSSGVFPPVAAAWFPKIIGLRRL
jgi:cyclohexa-1,5-dienecarbonyl-CoA hydratase